MRLWLSHALLRPLDPRRSLIARAIYLICALGIAFSTAAGIWVGGIARENVLDQHVRRLSLETDQLSSDLSQALAARIGAVSTARILFGRNENAAPMVDLGRSYEEMVSAYPQLDWIAIADASGTVVRSNGSLREGVRVDGRQWFLAGLRGTWLGVIEETPDAIHVSTLTTRSGISTLGDMALPVEDNEGHVIGVIAAHLSWRRTPDHAERLTDEAYSLSTTEAYVLDDKNVVLIGPARSRGLPWSGARIDGQQNAAALSHPPLQAGYPVFERLANGQRALVSRSALDAVNAKAPVGLQVLLSEPNERVYQRANAVTKQILWASLLIGAIIALIGALGIRHLTRRLQQLTLSVTAVRRNNTDSISVPDGIDEVSQLGAAFSSLIEDLAQERRELRTLASDLECRVAVRTREVERLAEESRDAAVVRERLKLARALHDTLAHSMMAIISEIRFIRRLQKHDPASVADELGRAEELAHAGLSEARSAIAQMRGTTPYETGLRLALAQEVERFCERTGLFGEFKATPEATRFGGERSEVLIRMTQEALRNIERHASANRVEIILGMASGTHLVLTIEDDGAGFDPRKPRPGHYGLVGLHEQAELLGADLTIDSAPRMGTRIRILVPLSSLLCGPTPI